MANSTNFCNVNNNGNSNNWNASNSNGVRPISRACFASSSNGETKFAGNQERKRPARALKLEQTEPTLLLTSSTAISGFLFPMGYLFDEATTIDALYQAFSLCKKGSDWKASVQRFELNLLPNLRRLQNELRSGTYRPQEYHEFVLNERGKERHIKSQPVRDRLVQRSFCDNVLIPVLRRYLIYDNGASLNGKGVSFARNRLECHLQRFFRKHGENGYVLKIDFSKFFDNIRHDVLFGRIAEKLDDPQALALLDIILQSNSTDVSDLSEPERKELFDGVFNSLGFTPSTKGEAFMPKGLGIGSQVSQICGVFALTRVDTLCKIVHQCKYYGRYMDDIYVIHEDKDFLKSLLEEIRVEALKIGLHINDRKTKVTPLRAGLVFMQVKYHFTATRHLVKRPSANKVVRERRKLKAYRGLLDRGLMTRKDIANAYQSWRGNMRQLDSYRSIKSTDKVYTKLFVDN